MGKFEITVVPLGEEFLLVSWPSTAISVDISEELLAFEKFISKHLSEFILATNPAYASLCIRFRNKKTSIAELTHLLLEAYQGFDFNSFETNKYWEIPVCYHPELGPDLIECATRTSLELATFIEIHTQPFYRVYFIGFLPGFLYLGGLDKKLFIPRKATPRTKVPKGAVGIAGQQTGIYPQASPGGWQLIGQTKVELFHPDQATPTPFQAGDYLKFTAITLEEFKTAPHFPILKSKEADA